MTQSLAALRLNVNENERPIQLKQKIITYEYYARCNNRSALNTSLAKMNQINIHMHRLLFRYETTTIFYLTNAFIDHLAFELIYIGVSVDRGRKICRIVELSFD